MLCFAATKAAYDSFRRRIATKSKRAFLAASCRPQPPDAIIFLIVSQRDAFSINKRA